MFLYIIKYSIFIMQMAQSITIKLYIIIITRKCYLCIVETLFNRIISFIYLQILNSLILHLI